MKIPFWGCPMLNFRADLPFHVMRPAYAAFEKEIPMALQSPVGFFKTLKCYEYCFFTSFFKIFPEPVLGKGSLTIFIIRGYL